MCVQGRGGSFAWRTVCTQHYRPLVTALWPAPRQRALTRCLHNRRTRPSRQLPLLVWRRRSRLSRVGRGASRKQCAGQTRTASAGAASGTGAVRRASSTCKQVLPRRHVEDSRFFTTLPTLFACKHTSARTLVFVVLDRRAGGRVAVLGGTASRLSATRCTQ